MEQQNEHRMEVRGSKGVSRIEVLDGPTGPRRVRKDVFCLMRMPVHRVGLRATSSRR